MMDSRFFVFSLTSLYVFQLHDVLTETLMMMMMMMMIMMMKMMMKMIMMMMMNCFCGMVD